MCSPCAAAPRPRPGRRRFRPASPMPAPADRSWPPSSTATPGGVAPWLADRLAGLVGEGPVDVVTWAPTGTGRRRHAWVRPGRGPGACARPPATAPRSPSARARPGRRAPDGSFAGRAPKWPEVPRPDRERPRRRGRRRGHNGCDARRGRRPRWSAPGLAAPAGWRWPPLRHVH